MSGFSRGLREWESASCGRLRGLLWPRAGPLCVGNGRWGGGASPCVGCGTHEHIVEEEEPALLGLDDLPAVVVHRLHHVIRADQVSAAAH